ncbi:MAG: HupE/UreJ family protein [Planctomycetota bacterium]|nr:MAG: HupE/UreJ family protein [Planctomycetota bacterium]
MAVAAVLLLTAGAAAGPTHPMSVSHLRVEVGAATTRLTLVVQTRTLAEVTPLALDLDGDLELSEGEIAAGWDRLTAYLEQGLTLRFDGAPEPARFTAWEFGGGDSELVGEASDRFRWLTLRGGIDRPAPGRLAVESTLFFDHGNPDHRMFLAVTGVAGSELYGLISTRERSCDFGAAPFLGYLGFGFRHVLAGADHLAFVLALLFGVRRLGALLAAVSSFTLAHTLTLALSALGVLGLAPEVVEPGIAFSVVAVLWLHLAQGSERARAWAPALSFGLLHGFGFAGVLGEIGLPPHFRLPALVGFNLGVELGQLAFVLPLVAAAAAMRALLPQRAGDARRLAGLLLGAFGFVLWGGVAARSWFAAGPTWAAPAAALALGALVLAALGRRRSPEGWPLAALAGAALLLAACYLAGRALAPAAA